MSAEEPRAPVAHRAAAMEPPSVDAGEHMQWHVIDWREEARAGSPGAVSAPACPSSTTASIPPPPISLAACHVRLNAAAHHSPVPSLTGRAHQRFDGERRLVCGCVPFRVDRSSADSEPQLSVLLVHAQKRGDWIFAKGGWEEVSNRRASRQTLRRADRRRGSLSRDSRVESLNSPPLFSHCFLCNLPLPHQFETAGECAQRECLEEGGVEGDLVCQLESVDFSSKKGKLSRLTPFLLRVRTFHRHFAEELKRGRKWVPFEQVESLMQRDETRTVWTNAKRALLEHGFLDSQGRAVFRPMEVEEENVNNNNTPSATPPLLHHPCESKTAAAPPATATVPTTPLSPSTLMAQT